MGLLHDEPRKGLASDLKQYRRDGGKCGLPATVRQASTSALNCARWGVVGSASGIICKMMSYSFQETKTSPLRLISGWLSIRRCWDFPLLRLTSSTAVMAPAGPISARLAPITRSSNRQGSTSMSFCPTLFSKSSQGGHRFNQQR